MTNLQSADLHHHFDQGKAAGWILLHPSDFIAVLELVYPDRIPLVDPDVAASGLAHVVVMGVPWVLHPQAPRIERYSG